MLAAFDGEDPNGTWILTVDDRSPDGYSGVVNGWSLQFEHGEQVVTTDANGDYAFRPPNSALKSGTYTVAEVQQPGWLQSWPGEVLDDFEDDNVSEYVPYGNPSYFIAASAFGCNPRSASLVGGLEGPDKSTSVGVELFLFASDQILLKCAPIAIEIDGA